MEDKVITKKEYLEECAELREKEGLAKKDTSKLQPSK